MLNRSLLINLRLKNFRFCAQIVVLRESDLSTFFLLGFFGSLVIH